MHLNDLFPQEDFRFKMRFARGSLKAFYGATAEAGRLLPERRHWLETAPNLYAALLPEGEPLLREAVELARSLESLTEATFLAQPSSASAWETCLALGCAWEPDYLLLKPGAEGQFRLCGGAVCFPSSWDLSEKMGRTMDVIHGVVPGLNAALGKPVDLFLSKLQPGLSWERANWGLSRSAERNHHPKRALPRLDAATPLEEVWLRVEHQSLAALPQTGGILFGIRLIIQPLLETRKDKERAAGLARALQTMPEEMARYKNLAAARHHLAEQLLRDE